MSTDIPFLIMQTLLWTLVEQATQSQTRDFQKSIADYSYVVDSIGTTDGEIFYFRANAYLNNRQKAEACTDLDKSVLLGYAAANQLKAQQCD